MSMIRFTSKKTFPIVVEVLKRISFSQTELAKELGISIGRINKVVSYLIKKDIIIKENKKYLVVQPNKLSDLVASQQNISKTRTYNIKINKTTLKELKKNMCILSNPSFLKFTKKNVEDFDEINLIDSIYVQNKLNNLPRGDSIITLFKYDTLDNSYPVSKNDFSSNLNSKSISNQDNSEINNAIRSIIDLKSVNKSHLVEDFALKLWGTRQ